MFRDGNAEGIKASFYVHIFRFAQYLTSRRKTNGQTNMAGSNENRFGFTRWHLCCFLSGTVSRMLEVAKKVANVANKMHIWIKLKFVTS